MEQKKCDEYFSFDDEKKEIVFKRYDMPTPWINYLSNGTFHTIISQAGGAVAFYKSPQIWRISRYRFFHLPTDRSGHYIYIQDAESGKYWSPTNEPCLLKPSVWESAHGMGYTRFKAERDQIMAELTYFVGPFENALIWNLKLKNNSEKKKRLNIFSYVEFGLMEFMRELQWQCYNKHQISVDYDAKSDALIYKYGVENQPKPKETPLVYLASDHKTVGFDGDRDEFIGSYRSESNPYSIENNGCTGSTLKGGDPCGALQFQISMEPNEEKELNIFLGTGMTTNEIASSLKHEREQGFAKKSFLALNKEWNTYLDKMQCFIPDQDGNRMINIWNPYQTQRNFMFSRNISFYATGTFRGVGFRDTSQDILAQIPFNPKASEDKVKLLLKEQYKDGHCNHYFFPIEGWDPVTTVHSDDHLWPVLAVWSIVAETGDSSFLNEIVPFYDNGSATIYDHLKRAIDFTLQNIGRHGFPLMLKSDWNDALFRVAKEGKGESIWTAMQFGVALRKMQELATLTGREDDAKAYKDHYENMKDVVNQLGWDGKWYRRATMDHGDFLGTDEQEEAKIWINAQTWSVLSGFAENGRGITAMDSVNKYLNTPLGLKAIYPPIVNFPNPENPLTNYNPGTGENGSVFCHANTWAVIAECLLRRGNQAYQYYRQLIPRVAMEKAGVWRYKAEPYVYSSNLFGPESDKFGLANVSWLTGTASWMYVAATQYILGVRPNLNGLIIDPCLPKEWKEAKIRREFQGCVYHIEIKNRTGEGVNVKKITVDGKRLKQNCINPIKNKKSVQVTVEL